MTWPATGVGVAALLRRVLKYWIVGPTPIDSQSVTLMPRIGAKFAENTRDERE